MVQNQFKPLSVTRFLLKSSSSREGRSAKLSGSVAQLSVSDTAPQADAVISIKDRHIVICYSPTSADIIFVGIQHSQNTTLTGPSLPSESGQERKRTRDGSGKGSSTIVMNFVLLQPQALQRESYSTLSRS